MREAMTIPRPNRDQVRAVARDLGMSLTDDDAQSYIGLMEASLATYEALEAMPDELPPVKYPRTPGREPAARRRSPAAASRSSGATCGCCRSSTWRCGNRCRERRQERRTLDIC